MVYDCVYIHHRPWKDKNMLKYDLSETDLSVDVDALQNLVDVHRETDLLTLCHCQPQVKNLDVIFTQQSSNQAGLWGMLLMVQSATDLNIRLHRVPANIHKYLKTVKLTQIFNIISCCQPMTISTDAKGKPVSHYQLYY
uniref:Uncharacterized protein n=1 Tax=Magnetococcus massalia (strain MO-1) TaxID=451514 RepID=A0A1S7LD31_MAGMO|nr:Protein of unknown function [Candidatus Magnetococcus massalia]